MGITGVCMWYAEDFLRYFPKIALDVAALIHFYEAWLAVGTIVIWHMYYMVLDPKTYPMNWSWITGRITEEDFKEHHPEEFERVTGKPAEDPENPAEKAEPALAGTIPPLERADDAHAKDESDPNP
jgi:cytochrome b subunit of formate dehydrogenase